MSMKESFERIQARYKMQAIETCISARAGYRMQAIVSCIRIKKACRMQTLVSCILHPDLYSRQVICLNIFRDADQAFCFFKYGQLPIGAGAVFQDFVHISQTVS